LTRYRELRRRQKPADPAPPASTPIEQIAKDPAEETASFVCKTIRIALKSFSGDVPREIANCLITKHLDDLVGFARDPNFVAVANAVVAKLNGITPSEKAELDNAIPPEASAEQMKQKLAELELPKVPEFLR
jgi:hypothetical protein